MVTDSVSMPRIVAVMFALVLGLGGTAHAIGPSWLAAQRIEPGQASINGLSCPTTTTCLAASSVPIVQDGGPAFEPSPAPDASEENAVSCVLGVRFCIFADDHGGVFSYADGAFSSVSDIDGVVSLEGISCASASFCMTIDHDAKVFKFSGGNWDGGTTLSPTGTFTNHVSISCASSAFCVAVASTSAGQESFTWNGSSWSSASSVFDAAGGYAHSLTCTSTTFCLDTDDAGYADVFNGTSWAAAHHIDTYNAGPQLSSSCVGTNCVAVDFYDNAFGTTDGTTWTSAVNIHADTLIAGVTAVACASATLCVAGDGLGNATTYAVPPAPGAPVLSGTAGVGQGLTLAHAVVQTPGVWYADDWRRCDAPDSACTLGPISTSPSAYTLASADAGAYIDARETFGFGLDEEQVVSNIVGPVVGDGAGQPAGGGTGQTPGGGSAGPGSAPVTGAVTRPASVTTTSRGVVTFSLKCAGGPCHGKATLTTASRVGSASYSAASGKTAKVKIKLTAAGRKQLKRHKGRLKVTLVITPVGGKPVRSTIELRVKL